MEAEIEGARILCERDFHREIASALGFPAHYGANLDALWDTLSADVERPVKLVWNNAEVSRKAMPKEFETITKLLKEVEESDKSFGWDDKFSSELK